MIKMIKIHITNFIALSGKTSWGPPTE